MNFSEKNIFQNNFQPVSHDEIRLKKPTKEKKVPESIDFNHLNYEEKGEIMKILHKFARKEITSQQLISLCTKLIKKTDKTLY